MFKHQGPEKLLFVIHINFDITGTNAIEAEVFSVCA